MGESIQQWSKRAKCRDTGLSAEELDKVFFATSPRESQIGKKICTGCPVKDPCKFYAIVHNEIGTWGGTTSFERRQIPKEFRALLQNIYLQNGLLEERASHLVPSELKEEQSQAQIVPISEIHPDEDPNEDLYFSA